MSQQTEMSIPGYKSLSIAGRGGMGLVYKAEQATPRRIVAVKVMTTAAPNPDEMTAFRHEAELIARLEHPHILPVYDFGEHEGLPYLVMRYLDGGSLADRIKQEAVDLNTAVRWLTRVADALDFAHQQGIVHKDIKPSNVLLDRSGQVYLTDFGIAGALQAPGSGTPLGSAAYMAPEQARGRSVDARADIYALAVMLFELLTGRKPYMAETAMGLMVRHTSDPIPSARAINPKIPTAVDELIQWGMAKEPGERPATAGEFARLLQQAVNRPHDPLRPPTSAPTETAVPVKAQPRGYGPFIWVGVLLLIAFCLLGTAVVTGGALFFTAAATPTPIPTATRLPTPSLSPTPQGLLLTDDFSVPGSGFVTTRADENDPDGEVTYADGRLRITVLTEGIEWFSPSGRIHEMDVTVEVTVQQESGVDGGHAAVICRRQDQANYIAFALSGEGTFAIWQKRADELYWLHDWSSAPALLPGDPHNLRITCTGPTLRFTANNILLAEVTDPQPILGDVALMAGLRTPGEFVVSFDDLSVTR